MRKSRDNIYHEISRNFDVHYITECLFNIISLDNTLQWGLYLLYVYDAITTQVTTTVGFFPEKRIVKGLVGSI